MEFLPVILTFIVAYGLFLCLAYILARVFFPTIEINDGERIPRKVKARERRILAKSR